MRQNSKCNNTKNKKAIATLSWLIFWGGISLVLVALIYNVFIMSSLYSMTRNATRPETDSHENHYGITNEKLSPNAAAASSMIRNTIILPRHTTNDKAKPVSEKDNQTANDLGQINKNQHNSNSYDIDEIQRREIQEIRESLPGNMMVPGNKPEAERNAIYADIEEQRQLQDLIQKNLATSYEKQRYYKLQAKRFEDEIELIQYCQEKLSNISDSEYIFHDLCSEITEHGEQIVEANQRSLENLHAACR
jgi:hypothetical protein